MTSLIDRSVQMFLNRTRVHCVNRLQFSTKLYKLPTMVKPGPMLNRMQSVLSGHKSAMCAPGISQSEKSENCTQAASFIQDFTVVVVLLGAVHECSLIITAHLIDVNTFCARKLLALNRESCTQHVRIRAHSFSSSQVVAACRYALNKN